MNAARLLEHFERISEAPDAVPRLRRFILDLAVRGNLVEQNPRDEPALELLKRILGNKRLSRWLALLLLASGEDPNQFPLISLSLRRGFFMERIGKWLLDGVNADELFFTGLFSLLDAGQVSSSANR